MGVFKPQQVPKLWRYSWISAPKCYWASLQILVAQIDIKTQCKSYLPNPTLLPHASGWLSTIKLPTSSWTHYCREFAITECTCARLKVYCGLSLERPWSWTCYIFCISSPNFKLETSIFMIDKCFPNKTIHFYIQQPKLCVNLKVPTIKLHLTITLLKWETLRQDEAYLIQASSRSWCHLALSLYLRAFLGTSGNAPWNFVSLHPLCAGLLNLGQTPAES